MAKKKKVKSVDWSAFETVFKDKAKRKAKALPTKGSTWLKKPPQRKTVKIREMGKKG